MSVTGISLIETEVQYMHLHIHWYHTRIFLFHKKNQSKKKGGGHQSTPLSTFGTKTKQKQQQQQQKTKNLKDWNREQKYLQLCLILNKKPHECFRIICFSEVNCTYYYLRLTVALIFNS